MPQPSPLSSLKKKNTNIDPFHTPQFFSAVIVVRKPRMLKLEVFVQFKLRKLIHRCKEIKELIDCLIATTSFPS